MQASLGAPEAMQASLKAFVDGEGINLAVASEGTVTVSKAPEGERPESDLDVLQSGGWIKCNVACSLAEKINISLPQMGKLLDHLDVKVRECGLGCF